MTEYYPLLAKAVASLPNSTPDTRRAIYERARKALLAQLQSLQPPVPEADVARETQALDDAVARLEAELKEKNGAANAGVSPAPQTPQPAPPPAPSATESKAPPRIPRPPVARQRPNGAPPEQPHGATTPAARPAPEVKEEAKDSLRDPGAAALLAAQSPKPRPETPRPEVSRPYLPQPEVDAPYSRRLWIVIAVVVIVVGLVAVAAWKLRDRPEDFASFKPVSQSQGEPSGGKIVERVGGGNAQQQAAQQPASSSQQAPEPQPTPPQQQTASQEAPAQAPATALQKPAETAPGVPIAYRAALLVEAPDEPNKVKTYVGTVIWRLENVNSDSGQPLGTAVRADIDIPDDKLKASMEIQKNTDASLSASHTITLIFNIAPDSPTGAIKQISIPQLRREDNQNGAPLRGILVPIMDNSFLIGLSRGDAEAGNLSMIKDLEWFDVPILLANGRVAKLTFEKNTSGSRAIEDALTSWQAQQ